MRRDRAERRRPGRVRRWLLRPVVWILTLVLLVGAGALWWVHRPSVQDRILHRILPRVEARLGRPVEVDRWRFTLVPLSVTVEGLRIAGPDSTSPPFLTLRRGRVTADITPWWERTVVLQAVELEGLAVRLERGQDGSLDYPRPARGGGGGAPARLRVDTLAVTDGRFHYLDRTVPLDVSARAVAVDVNGVGGQLVGRFAAQDVEADLPRTDRYPAAVAGRVAIGRKDLKLSALRLSGPGLSVRGEGSIGWGNDRRVELGLRGEAGSELLRRLGYLESDVVSGGAEFDGSFAWRPERWGYEARFRAHELRLLRWGLTDGEGVVRGGPEGVRIDLEGAEYAGGTVQGQVRVSRGGDRATVEVDGELAGLQLRRFLDDSGLSLAGVSGRLGGHLSYRFAAGEWRQGQGWGEVTVSLPKVVRGLPLQGRASLVVEEGRVRSEAIRLRSVGQRVLASGWFDLEAQQGLFRYTLRSDQVGRLTQLLPVREESGEVPAWLPTSGTGEAEGTLLVSAEGAASDLELTLAQVVAPGIAADEVKGTLHVDPSGLDPLRLELTKGEASALVEGHFPFDDRPWRLSLDASGWPVGDAEPWLPFPFPVQGAAHGQLSLFGEPDGGVEGSVSATVSPVAAAGMEADQATVRLHFDPERVDLERVEVEAPAGAVTVSGEAGLEGRPLELRLHGEDLDVARPPLSGLLGEALAGTLTVEGRLGGTLDEPVLESSLTAHALELGGEPLGREGATLLNLDWKEGRLQIEGSLLGLARLHGGGALDGERTDLKVAFEVPALGALAQLAAGIALEGVEGMASGELAVSGSLAAGLPEVTLRVDQLEATAAGRELHLFEPARARLDRDRLLVESLFLGEQEGRSELFVAGSVAFEDGSLDLNAQATLPNAILQPALADLELGGTTDLLVDVGGSLDAPELRGQASVHDGRVVVAGFPHPITQLQAFVLLDPDAVILDNAVADCAGGTLRMSGRLAWPLSEEWRLQARARGITLRWPEGWLIRGDADAALTSGPAGRELSGVAELQRASYLQDLEIGTLEMLQRVFRRQRQEVGVVNELLSEVRLDLLVRATDALRVRNNVADLRGGGVLTLRGTLARPVPVGRVEAEPGGTLVFSDTRYQVEHATLDFVSRHRLEPLVDLQATTEVAEYRLTLNLSGSLDGLNASFASDPPLPDLQVVQLLFGGATPGAEGTLSEAGRASAGSAANTVLAKQAASLISERVGALFGVDAFTITPLASSGEAVSSARITVGQRLSRDLYVTYSYDPSTTEEQRLQAEWQVARGFTLVLTQNGDGSYAVDARWEQRF